MLKEGAMAQWQNIYLCCAVPGFCTIARCLTESCTTSTTDLQAKKPCWKKKGGNPILAASMSNAVRQVCVCLYGWVSARLRSGG